MVVVAVADETTIPAMAVAGAAVGEAVETEDMVAVAPWRRPWWDGRGKRQPEGTAGGASSGRSFLLQSQGSPNGAAPLERRLVGLPRAPQRRRFRVRVGPQEAAVHDRRPHEEYHRGLACCPCPLLFSGKGRQPAREHSANGGRRSVVRHLIAAAPSFLPVVRRPGRGDDRTTRRAVRSWRRRPQEPDAFGPVAAFDRRDAARRLPVRHLSASGGGPGTAAEGQPHAGASRCVFSRRGRVVVKVAANPVALTVLLRNSYFRECGLSLYLNIFLY